ncbi:MAG: hypothetical protein KDA89_15525 [Planctomycetaceae bacterium]|nr:hypothetical protein [Planctomycetaceae bacterium]
MLLLRSLLPFGISQWLYSCTRRIARFSVGLLTVVVLSSACLAEDDRVLHLVPRDALGAVVIRSAEGLRQKLESLSGQSGLPIPDLVAQARTASGFTDGIDESGNIAAVIMKPPADDSSPVAVVYLVAENNHAKLLESVNASPAENGLATAGVRNRKLLIGSKGGFAVIAAEKFRENLTAVLESAESAATELTPLSDRMSSADVYAVVTPSGLQMLQEKLLQGLALVKSRIPASQASDTNVAAGLAVYEELFHSIDREYTHGFWGLRFSDDGVRFLKSGMLTSDGTLQKISLAAGSASLSQIQTFGDDSFVFGGVLSVPEAMSNYLTDYSMKFLTMYMPNGGLTEQDAQELAELTRELMRGMTDMSFLFGTPGEGRPIYENTYFTLRTPDAAGFLKQYEQVIVRMNEVMSRVKDSPFKYATSHSTLDDRDVLELHADVSGFLQNQPIPQTRQMLHRLFGDKGEVTVYLTAVDETTVVGQYISKERLAERINQLLSNSSGTSDSAVAATRALLPKNSFGIGFWSPAGTIRMVRQVVSGFMPSAGRLPEFPESPPMAGALSFSGGRIDLDAVIPAATIQAFGQFVRSIQELRQRRQ